MTKPFDREYVRARFATEEGPGRFQCFLCPHHCRLGPGQDGLCRVRGVRDRQARALGYGVISAAQVDPVERKPLYHFYPGAAGLLMDERRMNKTGSLDQENTK